MQRHWIVSNVPLDKCIFKSLFKKAGHTIAHSDGAVCGHVGCVGQTNVVGRKRGVLFFSPPSFFFCQCYQWYRTKRFIFSILGEDTAMYQCIPPAKSLQTFFLNNMLVSVSSPPLLFSLHSVFAVACISSKQHDAVNERSAALQVNLLSLVVLFFLHVWLNLTARAALGQFIWHFRSARPSLPGLCSRETTRRERESKRGLLCLLMMA